jgi:hypothetical protein
MEPVTPKEGQTGTYKGRPVIYLDGKSRFMNEAGMAIMGGGFYKARDGRIYREGPKGGFAQVGGPTQAQSDKYAEKATLTNEALGALDMFDEKLGKVKTTGPFGWIANGDDLAEASQLANDLMLRLKEKPYNLGVLNGPDLDILQRVISDPTTLKDAVFRKSVQPRLRNIAKKLGDTYRGDMTAYESTGGEPSAMPPVFRSPRSQYSAEEWGHDARVPQLKPRSGPAAAPGAPGATTLKIGGQSVTIREKAR